MKKFLCLLTSCVFVFCAFGTEGVRAFFDDSVCEYVVVLENDNKKKNEISTLCGAGEIGDNMFTCSLTSYEAAQLRCNDSVAAVEEDVLFSASAEEVSETTEITQWNLDVLGIDENNEAIQNTGKISIAILDSGVDYSEDFDVKGKVNLSDDGNENVLFTDSTGHGSAIASVIAAQRNDVGINGINPNADIYSVKVLDSQNQAPLSKITEGIYWCINNGIQIINMSFGTNVDSDILHAAIIDAYNAGILLVAAAGNTEHQALQYPAAYDEVVSVGSVNACGELSENTSIGENLDVLAPGENILAFNFLDTVSTVSGTSIATAQVTAIASSLWAMDSTKSNDFIKQLICSAVNRPDTLTGTNAGIVNYAAAAEAYDEFAETYTPIGISNSDFSVKENFDYSEEASIKVDGLWMNSGTVDGHYTLSDSATTYAGFSGYAPEITRYACTHLDANNKVGGEISDGKVVGGPHGAGNYMINLRFLFLASRCIYDNGTGEEFKELCNSFENNDKYWSAENNAGSPAGYNWKRFKCMVEQVEAFLSGKQILLDKIEKNFDNYSTEAQNRYLGLMIFGMALHLAGDMYAHRTIVPAYTVKNVTAKTKSKNTAGQSVFGTSDFTTISNFVLSEELKQTIGNVCFKDQTVSTDPYVKYWEYFQLGVTMEVVEFRDIKKFITGANVYEDYADFCPERYTASMLACKRLAKRFKEAGSFYTKLVYPKYYNSTTERNAVFQTVKLNNFKNYTQAAGLDLTGVDLTESDWLINSNAALV